MLLCCIEPDSTPQTRRLFGDECYYDERLGGAESYLLHL